MDELPSRDVFGTGGQPSPNLGGVFGSAYNGPRISVPNCPPPAAPAAEPVPKRRLRKVLVPLLVVVAAAAVTFGVENIGSTGTTTALQPNGLGGNPTRPSHQSSTSDEKPDLTALAAQVDPAVVDIISTLANGAGQAAGTGMVVTPSGEVLTNNHVIDQATSITAQIDGKGRTYSAMVVGTDPSSDVALLQMVGVSDLKTVSFGDSSAVTVGEPVVAIGNALDLPGPPKVTEGKVTQLNRPIIAQDSGTALCETLSGMIQTNAKLEPGNSGGPLVNSAGQVIGINTAAASGGQTRGISSAGSKIGFAIPIVKAVQIVTAMRSGKASSTIHLGPAPLLGVLVTGVNDSGTGSVCSTSGGGGPPLGPTAPVNSGALVVKVEAGSPAQMAGIQDGDAIVSFAGDSVTTAQSLTRLVQSKNPGDHVEVSWVDLVGATHRTMVTLASGPAD